MRRLSVLAILVALISLGVSGWALSRTYDTEESDASAEPDPSSDTTTTTIPLVVVPGVVGKPGIVAATELGGFNLRFVAVRAPSVTVAPGTVISQRPPQGTEVPEGTEVELTLSSGPL